MEKITDKIERLLQEKLSLYQKLQSLLELEKTHVIGMDVDSLWITVSQKKTLTKQIETIRQRIISLFSETHSSLTVDTPSFSLTSLIKTLNVSSETKADLKKIIFSIHTCKEEIIQRASENKNFINEYLTIIDGIFGTLLDIADKKGYGHSGTMLKTSGKNCLIHAEV